MKFVLQLVYNRVQLLVTFLRKSDSMVLSILYHSRNMRRSWISSVEGDLMFLAANCSLLSYYVGKPIHAWYESFYARPAKMLQCLKKALLQLTNDAAEAASQSSQPPPPS